MRFRTCWAFVLAIVLSLCLPRTAGFSDLSLTNDNGIEVASDISLDLPVLAIEASYVLHVADVGRTNSADASFMDSEQAQVLITSAYLADMLETQRLTPRPTHTRRVLYHLRT